MRIAFVTDSYWPRVNGVTVSVHTFREELARRGHASIVLCPEYPEAAEGSAGAGGAAADGDYVVRFPSVQSLVSPEDRLVRLDAFPSIFRTLDRFHPDLIYVQTEFSMQIAGRIYARRHGLPFICCAHTDYEDYAAHYFARLSTGPMQATARFLMKWVYGTADFVVTPSRSMERVLKAYGIDKPFHVIPTGIPHIFSPKGAEEVARHRAALEAKHPQLAGKRILLFAGRVTEEKGVHFLVPVLERILETRRDAALLIAGDGPYREHLETIVAHHRLQGSVAFAGYVPRDELPFVYAAAEVFVFPSRTETLGLCTIEAMATGTPVVAIGEMGTRDVMEGDNGGFMVRADVGEFTSAVLRLLCDEDLRRAKSAEAIAWSRRFSIDTEADRLIALLERTIHPHGKRRLGHRR